jgi:hypothetical protein
MISGAQQKIADGGVAVGWFGYIVSHIEQINGVLQTVLLIASIIATIIAARYHLRRTPK